MCLCRVWIELQRSEKFRGRFSEPIRFLQGRAVVDVCPRAGRKIGDNSGESIELRVGRMDLAEPERAKRNDKHPNPFHAVQQPARQRTARCHVGRAATDSERLASGFLAHLPDEAIIIKVQKSRGCDDTGEYAFQTVDPDVRFEITERAIGQYQADIETDERAAARSE